MGEQQAHAHLTPPHEQEGGSTRREREHTREQEREKNVSVLFIYCLGLGPRCGRTEFVAK